jgi:hypothetical protein
VYPSSLYIHVFCCALTTWGSRGKGKVPTATVTVIERAEAHYEVQDVEMGKVCRWCPESIVIRCRFMETARDSLSINLQKLTTY